MIGYVTVGTSDLKKAGVFYDKICGELAMGRFMANDRIIAWGAPGGAAGFGVALPYDGKPMTVGNGVMAAFGAKNKAHVDRVYKLALSLGGSCEGAPGQRSGKILRRLFSRSRGQQAQRLRDGLTQRELLCPRHFQIMEVARIVFTKRRIIRLHPWPAQL